MKNLFTIFLSFFVIGSIFAGDLNKVKIDKLRFIEKSDEDVIEKGIKAGLVEYSIEKFKISNEFFGGVFASKNDVGIDLNDNGESKKYCIYLQDPNQSDIVFLTTVNVNSTHNFKKWKKSLKLSLSLNTKLLQYNYLLDNNNIFADLEKIIVSNSKFDKYVTDLGIKGSQRDFTVSSNGFQKVKPELKYYPVMKTIFNKSSTITKPSEVAAGTIEIPKISVKQTFYYSLQNKVAWRSKDSNYYYGYFFLHLVFPDIIFVYQKNIHKYGIKNNWLSLIISVRMPIDKKKNKV